MAFELVSQKGSHRKWRNHGSGLQVIVPEPSRPNAAAGHIAFNPKALNFLSQNGEGLDSEPLATSRLRYPPDR